MLERKRWAGSAAAGPGRLTRCIAGSLVVLLVAAGCGPDGGPRPGPSAGPTFDQALHDELVAMAKRDQAGRSGGEDLEGDLARTGRLQQIITGHGWPTTDLVGRDGADAAWLIAQHSDADPAFQARALALITAAAEAGQASWGNVAYLSDRVRVGQGRPQTYGTQIRCGPAGPEPSTPIEDAATVDERRATAGLEPLADYFAELAPTCAAERTPPSRR